MTMARKTLTLPEEHADFYRNNPKKNASEIFQRATEADPDYQRWKHITQDATIEE